MRSSLLVKQFVSMGAAKVEHTRQIRPGNIVYCVVNGPHILAVGEGRWDTPGNSWELAAALGRRGVPTRVDRWGPPHDHDWPTWREMLPKYMSEMV